VVTPPGEAAEPVQPPEPLEPAPAPVAQSQPEPAPEPEAADPTPTQEDLDVVARVEQPPQPTAREKRADASPEEPPVRMTFRPRTRARTAVGVGALLAAGSAVVLTIVAFQERDEASIGIAGTLWVLTGIIWAVHSGTSVTRLSVRGGQLQVIRHGVRTTIDLTSSYTPVEVYGRPGRHGWMVVFRRRDLTPFVIDHSMVDATEFMRVLRYYRPEVDAQAG
jgi:hypothetical protein